MENRFNRNLARNNPYRPNLTNTRRLYKTPLIKSKMNLIFVLFAVLFVGAIGFQVAFHTANTTTSTCTVVSKDRTYNSDQGQSNMRVYTEECGTLEVQDSIFLGIFNSADIYGNLKEGETYTITRVGWRVPILSMFPVIKEVQ